MGLLKIERVGGLAGFGGSRSRVRSHGQIETAELSASDQSAVEALFKGDQVKMGKGADSFGFRISRVTASGEETVEAPEELVPFALASCVRDELK